MSFKPYTEKNLGRIRIHHPGSGSADPDPDPHQNDTDPKHWSRKLKNREEEFGCSCGILGNYEFF